MPKYIANTAVFQHLIQAQVPYQKIMQQTKALGFDVLELRSEWLDLQPTALKQLQKQAQQINLPLYLSINDVLFQAGQLNPKLSQYVYLQQTLQAQSLKLNLGEFVLTNAKWSTQLAQILPADCQLEIENNQTPTQSDLTQTAQFFQSLTPQLSNVHYCFDVANWYWLDASINQAWQVLQPLTNYLHLKNVQNQQVTADLMQGTISWSDFLQTVPQIAQIGFEYATDQATLAQNLQQIQHLLAK